MQVECSIVTTPEVDESDWVPLQNPFSQNLTKRDEQNEQDFTFTVVRGTSDTQVCIMFTGCLGEEEEWNLQEEMSFDKLLTLHRQMVELYPDDVSEELLPQLPTVPRGIWSYLLSVDIREGFYEELVQYLNTLVSRCSVENVLAVFFEDAFLSPAQYEDEWSDLNKKHYLDEREAGQREWEELLMRRSRSTFRNMQELHDYYEEEDIAEYHLGKAEDKLHAFQIKPFEDLCEITRKRRDEASARAKNPELPLADQVKALHEEREFHDQYLEASESLHELVIERHRAVAERVEGVFQRMSEDHESLGHLWDRRAQSRMDRMEDKLNRAILEMLQTQCRRLADQKDRALLDMAIVEEGPNMEEEVRAREDTVYRIQLRLLEIQLRLLDEEERKLKLQERYATGDDLAGIQLRLERIPSKMSKLRLKMQHCKQQLDHPKKRTINVEESYAAHLAAQKKEAVVKKEEEKRKRFMKDQRQKTIQRVKQYMEKNPVPVKKLPPRYQRPSQRQDTRHTKKQPEKKTPQPAPSRVSHMAALTKSVYTRKTVEISGVGSKGGSGKKGGSSKNQRVKQQSRGPPPVPAPLESVQAIAEMAKNIPAPPPPPPPAQVAPPPPPPPLQAPPPPSQPVPKPRTHPPSPVKHSTTNKAKTTTGGGINLHAIISARQRLKPTDLGKVIGETTTTSEEVACLVRSGASAGTASLTKDGASFLKQRFRHIKEVTQLSDQSDSEDDIDEWN